jgi:hypothetical protein
MNEKDAVDWLAVEADYRPNKLSLRAIGEKHGCTEGAIRKRAKKEGWVRDFISQISNTKKVVLDKSIEDKYNRSGFVYVIYLDDTSESRFYKIGMSSNFNNRLDTHQGSSPFNICVACAYYVGNMREEERALHSMFENKRIRGEWFDLNEIDLTTIASRALLV